VWCVDCAKEVQRRGKKCFFFLPFPVCGDLTMDDADETIKDMSAEEYPLVNTLESQAGL